MSGDTRVFNFTGSLLRLQIWIRDKILSRPAFFSVSQDVEFSQIGAQLRHRLELNGVNADFLGSFQIEAAIINHHAFFRTTLSNFQNETIDFSTRFAQAEIARAEKGFEVLEQIKCLDAVLVEFLRFVVERSDHVTTGLREPLQEVERFGKRLGLLEHEFLEIVGGEGMFAVENRAAKIFVESDASSFEIIEHQFVAVFEIGPIELEFLDRGPAGIAVPAVGENHAAVIPEQRFDFSHRNLVSSGFRVTGGPVSRVTIILKSGVWPPDNLLVP